jgi:hypothetical protein
MEAAAPPGNTVYQVVVKSGVRLVTDQPFPIDFDPAELF